MDLDLGMGWAALYWVACSYESCKDQLESPWVPCSCIYAQPRNTQNKECTLWPSYEGANDWKICALVPKMEADKKGAQESLHCILNAMEACMSLMMCKDEVCAVGTVNEMMMGYYIVKWLSEPFTLQVDIGGMYGMNSAGTMVANALYSNQVQHAPLWYLVHTVRQHGSHGGTACAVD
jgi:hypothetical protein